MDNLLKGSTNSILFSHKIKEQEHQEDPMINEVIFKKIEVIKKIGKTSTIDIYEGISKENNQPVTIKMEEKVNDKLYLESEAYNLYSFKGFGIPELIKFGKRKNKLILIESKKGKSLNELFIENNKKFTLNEICLIGIQCIERLKYIHSKNYIHRNIKPENFVIGIEDPHIIYLQNFYLCEKYKSGKTNQHAKFKYTKEIVGTERYGSINALRGLRQGRKDDLESLCYMLIYFFLGNIKLPWQGLKAENEISKHEKLLKEKKNFKIENYKQIPKDFCKIFKYVRNLKFEEEPKYSIMIRLLQKIRNDNQLYSNTNFYWIKKNNICKGSNIKSKKENFRERLYSKIDESKRIEILSDFEKKVIKNIDVNFENIGLGYIDDDEDEEKENSYKEKSEYHAKVYNRSLTYDKLKDKNQEENEEEKDEDNNKENKADELNISNSSINTKVYKLNGPIESVIKKDIMNDPDINNVDDLSKSESVQNSKLSKTSKKKIEVTTVISNNYNDVIKEENDEEEENSYEKKIEKVENIVQNNNFIKNDKNINKNIGSYNLKSTSKQESTKESIQFNFKESDFKGNNDPASIIIVKKSNDNDNKKEDVKNISNNNNINKNVVQKKEKKSVDSKILVTKKAVDSKFGQIAGPVVLEARSKTINKTKKRGKKQNGKDCLIF